MNGKLTVGQVIKKAGGVANVVRILGYPVNRYTVESWRRKRDIPNVYRGKLAEALGLKAEQMEPDIEGRVIRIGQGGQVGQVGRQRHPGILFLPPYCGAA